MIHDDVVFWLLIPFRDHEQPNTNNLFEQYSASIVTSAPTFACVFIPVVGKQCPQPLAVSIQYNLFLKNKVWNKYLFSLSLQTHNRIEIFSTPLHDGETLQL